MSGQTVPVPHKCATCTRAGSSARFGNDGILPRFMMHIGGCLRCRSFFDRASEPFRKSEARHGTSVIGCISAAESSAAIDPDFPESCPRWDGTRRTAVRRGGQGAGRSMRRMTSVFSTIRWKGTASTCNATRASRSTFSPDYAPRWL